jgi:hypothetical protein
MRQVLSTMHSLLKEMVSYKIYDLICYTDEFTQKNPTLMEEAAHLLVPEGFPVIRLAEC